MSAEPRQLALDWPVEPRLGLEDFLVGDANHTAYAMIEAWPAWPDALLRVEGPPGSGKTHLASIWAERAQARMVTGDRIGEVSPHELLSQGALVVEDADGAPLDEPAFFHLLNVTRGQGAFILVTARAAPERWGLVTPDLLSRLRLAPAVTLALPDDALLRALLVKLFIDRQTVVDTTVVDYLVRRIERSYDAAAEAVRMLDRHALSAGRRITRSLAAEILSQVVATQEEDDDDGA